MSKSSSKATIRTKHKNRHSQTIIADTAPIASPTLLSKNRNLYLLLFALLVITFLLYANSLHYELLNFDDNEYFTNYPEITHLSWQSIQSYFTHYYVIMYQPLVVLTFAINHYFSQLDTIPLHLGNLILHLVNVLLIYTFIYKLSSKKLIAIIAATLFAVHPMNVEAVTWISARSSSLYTLFYTLSIILYLNYLNLQQRKYLIFAGLAFILSLFSKAQAVTLPMMLLAIDYYYSRITRTSLGSILIEKSPFFILSFLFGLITILNQDTINNITNGMMIAYTLPEAICLACYSFVFYLYKFFIPINLCAIYVYPPRVHDALPMIYYLSPVILLAISYLIYRVAQHRKYIVFGIFVFLITISINIQIIPSRLFIVADRYSYFPYIGLFFIIGAFYNELIEKTASLNLGWKQILFGILLLYTLLCITLTIQRNTIWENNIVLTTDIINKNSAEPYISRAYGTRANALHHNNHVQAALADYKKAIEIYPIDSTSYLNRALLYTEIKNYNAALDDLNQAIKLQPKSSLMYSKRGLVQYNMQDNKDALDNFNQALKLDPNNVEAYNIRAIIRFSENDYQGSEDDFSHAIHLEPLNSELYKNRGIMALKLLHLEKACKDFTTAANMGNKTVAEMLQQYCKKTVLSQKN